MDKKLQDSKLQQPQQQQKKPDEKGGILVQSHLKIFDPETNKVYVNGRA